jgi:hypothetical protein
MANTICTYWTCRIEVLNSRTYNADPWPRDELPSAELTLTVNQVSESAVSMTLTGQALVSAQGAKGESTRGYQGRLLGYLDYDRKQQLCTRFDVVAVGENWCKEKRVGNLPERLTVGVACELVPTTSGFYEVSPAFLLYTADYKEYLGQQAGK